VGIQEQEILRRGLVELHPRFDYSFYTNDEILLVHTVAHNLFAVQKPKKDFIALSHRKIVEEMKKRGLPHSPFDKLDKL
jgi:hypothetical protein